MGRGTILKRVWSWLSTAADLQQFGILAWLLGCALSASGFIWAALQESVWRVCLLAIPSAIILTMTAVLMVAEMRRKGRRESVGKNAPTPQVTEPSKPLPDKIADLPSSQNEKISELDIAAREFRREARLWEYKFLNGFLALSSQTVMNWLYQVGSFPLNQFDSHWLPLIPSKEERTTILLVLESHFLVEAAGSSVAITEKGREYVDWRGPFNYDAVMAIKREIVINTYRELDAAGLVPKQKRRPKRPTQNTPDVPKSEGTSSHP